MTDDKPTFEMTQDMAATLLQHFPAYENGNVVTLEKHAGGLWLVNPHDGSRQFLGSASPLGWGHSNRAMKLC